MSQENAKARHQKTKLLRDSELKGFAVISTESSKPKVPLQKRKEQAKETLYLKRI